MAVDVDLIAPVVVAALGNANDAVAVIDTLNEHATRDGPGIAGVDLLERFVAALTKLIEP